jgi:hypothetical protein
MLTAAPIFLPEDPELGAKEIPVEAEMTRDFIPEIDILQRERTDDAPMWMWGVANLIVLLCSLAILAGISVAVGRVSRSIGEHEAREKRSGDASTLTP